LAYKIKLQFEPAPGKEAYVIEETYYSGISVYPFPMELARPYNVTVWAITHEGVGKQTFLEFTSAGDGKYKCGFKFI
jgi:hypothetical protein